MTPLAPNFNVGCVLSLFFHDQGLEANLVDAVNIEIGGSGGAAFDRRSLRIVSCLSFLFSCQPVQSSPMSVAES